MKDLSKRTDAGELSAWARITSHVTKPHGVGSRSVRGAASLRYHRLLELSHGPRKSVAVALSQTPQGFSRLVVLQTLGAARASDPEAIQRLLFEARLLGRMSHPHVLGAHGLCFEGRKPVIASEYLEGQTLEALIAKASSSPEFSLPLRVGIVCRVLRGLQYVHDLRGVDGRRLSVVHGAVSPSNVMLTYEGEVKLIDFSHAVMRPSLIERSFIDTNFAYLAPERVRGNPDQRVDVFSAGVVLWELLAQAPLWGHMPAAVVLRRLLLGAVPRLRDVRPDCDPELEQICNRAMAVNPGDRFESASTMCDALERFLASKGKHVSDTSIGAMLSNLCREERCQREEALISRLDALGLSLHEERGSPRGPFGAKLIALFEQRTPRALALGGVLLAATALGGYAAAHGAARPPARAVEQTRQLTLSPSRRSCQGVAPAQPGRDEPPVTMADLVTLEIAVEPAEATLYLDGQRLSSNPVIASMVKDARLHTLRGEAQGFWPFSQTFSLDADLALQATLRPLANPTSPRFTLARRRIADSRGSGGAPRHARRRTP
jgi:serine/threonine protein kinase